MHDHEPTRPGILPDGKQGRRTGKNPRRINRASRDDVHHHMPPTRPDEMHDEDRSTVTTHRTPPSITPTSPMPTPAIARTHRFRSPPGRRRRPSRHSRTVMAPMKGWPAGVRGPSGEAEDPHHFPFAPCPGRARRSRTRGRHERDRGVEGREHPRKEVLRPMRSGTSVIPCGLSQRAARRDVGPERTIDIQILAGPEQRTQKKSDPRRKRILWTTACLLEQPTGNRRMLSRP